jgi:tetratricopeptide (TPR) repeat protein
MSNQGLEQLADAKTRRLDDLRGRISDLLSSGYDHLAIQRCTEALEASDTATLLEGALRTERADLWLDIDRPDKALDDIERALSIGWKRADTYSIGGWAEFAVDAPEDAKQYFERALELDPEHIPALIGRSFVLQQLERFERAVSDLSFAINHEPENPQLYAFRAEIRLEADQLDEAKADIQKAVEIAPDAPEFELQLARIAVAEGRPSEAFEQLTEIDFPLETPIGFEAALLESHLALSHQRQAHAKSLVLPAANTYPESPFAFVQLARIGLYEERYEWAYRMADRAVELDPSVPDVYLARAAAAKKLGDDEQADADWERGQKAEIELPLILLDYCYAYDGGFELEDEILLEFEKPFFGASTSEAESGAEAFGFDEQPGDEQDFQSDPMSMFGYAFDDSGEIKPQFRPMLEMIVQNAPNIVENLPSGLVQQLGGVDPEKLQQADLSEMSTEEIEERLKQLYKLMESGQNPFDNNEPPNGPGNS